MSEKFFRQSGEPGVMETRGRGIFFDEGGTVPANATVGYAPNCLFLATTAAGGVTGVYINYGTFASSLFRAISGVDLFGLLATATEINRNNKVSTRLAVATATLGVTISQEGRTILLSALAGFTSTLPAATGSGGVYKFMVGIVNTSNAYIIAAAGSDVFNGSLPVSVPGSTWATAAKGETFLSTTNQTITLNSTASGATGGFNIGDWVTVQDILSGVWSVTGWLTNNTGVAPLTPFS